VKIVERCRFEDSRAFDREFEGMAQFEPISREHHGFVDILHVGRSDDEAFFYYVMELADDVVQRPTFEPAAYEPKTLRSELLRVTRLPAEEVVALGLSLTAALAALHRHGLVHRDIKPANIIFCGGIPKIADIGLVSAMGQDSFVGTEGYVPPEGPGTAQADLYSLGKVLYEIAMGKDRLDFPALNTDIGELPDREVLMRLNEVLLRACNFSVAKRYAAADEMHEDLERVRDGRPLLGGRTMRRLWIPMAALLIAGTAGFAWYRAGNSGLGFGGGGSSASGSALIETDPPNVPFRIEGPEGRLVQSNGPILNLPPGTYTGHIFDRKFEKLDFKFTVNPGAQTHPPLFQLQRSMGAVRILPKTPDCDVDLCNGHDVIKTVHVSGSAPIEWKDVPTGSYELLLRREGRQKSVPIEVERLDTDLPPPLEIGFAMRDFKITSLPEGAEIFADGKKVGVAPCTVSLIEGPHKLTAHYHQWPEAVRDISDDSPEGVVFSFPKGSVKIITKPSGADIYRGVVKSGEPLPPKLDGTLDEDLEPGEVVYTVALPGMSVAKAPTVKAIVEPGKQVKAEYRFESKPAPRWGEPWENSLGMKFVPVGDILVGIWPVRVSEYNIYCNEMGKARVIDFKQDDNHPAVRVNWDDAIAFCEWLTRRERAENRLDDGQVYRLPTDAEWSAAAGMAPEGGATPEQRDGLVRDLPWGRGWPPPPGSGNYADTSAKRASRSSTIPNYTDGFPQTSPVGTFPPNKLGLYDMSGNVWQWVADSYNGGTQRRDWGVLRGGSWGTSKQEELRLGYRDVVDRSEADVIFGFRCVIAPEQ
jgi:formylglycine-generating enzyme required for sulfatase activity/serine/threonine protein kinase